MERPTTSWVEIQPFLAAHSRSAPNDLFQIGPRHLRFKYMDIFDIKQINALFESAVHHNESREFPVRIVGACIKLFEYLLAHRHRDGLS